MPGPARARVLRQRWQGPDRPGGVTRPAASGGESPTGAGDGTGRAAPCRHPADIVSAGVAAIHARPAVRSTPTLLYAASNNGGYITYLSPLRQAVTLRGAAQITGTRGLGTDLVSAWSSSPDPLAVADPAVALAGARAADLPVAGSGPRARSLAFDCSFEPGKVSETTILQVRLSWRRDQRNLHRTERQLREPPFCRRRQRLRLAHAPVDGPKMDLVDVQVIEPYTGADAGSAIRRRRRLLSHFSERSGKAGTAG